MKNLAKLAISASIIALATSVSAQDYPDSGATHGRGAGTDRRDHTA
jgi:hypothetical protein